jgi:hypothetical protein
MVWTKMALKASLLGVLTGGVLLFAGPASVRPDVDGCYRNVEKWESRLDREIYRYGYYSRQAGHDRHELAEAREQCQRRFGNRWHSHNDGDRDDYYR